MTDNDQLLHKIGNLIDQKLEPIKKDMAMKVDIQRLEQGQHSLHEGQGKLETMLEAVAAGQKEIQETMATKADIHRLEQKIDKVDKHVKSHESRIDNLEDEAGLPNPHKN